MSANYRPMRIPIEVYENLRKKRKKMEEVASEIAGRKVTIPFTKILKTLTARPLVLNDKQLFDLEFNRKRKKEKGFKI